MDEITRKKMSLEFISRPTLCQECGGILIYRGIGEYQCEECKALEYDDYGKVRGYLEKHKGANVAEISEQTGVTHKSIREMIKDKRFEVINPKGGYIRCEICGESISSGRFCSNCELEYHRKIEAQVRANRNMDMSGFGNISKGDKGSKRFTREKQKEKKQ